MKRFFKLFETNKKQNFQEFSKLTNSQLIKIKGGDNPPEEEEEKGTNN